MSMEKPKTKPKSALSPQKPPSPKRTETGEEGLGGEGQKGSARGQGGPTPPAKPPPPVPAPAPVPPLFRKIDWITFAVTTALVWTGYYLTLAPDLTLEDSGELAVGSFYAGIPHPPGYPVWTIYTWLWTLLPFKNVAWRVALGEATGGAIASGLLGFLVSRGSSMMMEGIADLKNIDRRWESAICVVSGFVAGTLLGFNGYMWSQSIIVEVYSFSVLSMMGVLLCLLRWLYAPHQHRYLCLAFFLHGICFNNHQSLLVIVIGMEAFVLVVEPKLGREFFFWNVVVYIGGLIGGQMGFLGVLTSNTPVYVIFNIIGLVSAGVWLWLAIQTRKRPVELARDFAMVGSFGYLVVIFGVITSYVTTFENSKGGLTLVNLLGIGAIILFVRLIQKTRAFSSGWLVALACGGTWSLGTAFYLYMAVAGMTCPPMQWGYPRTVEGFFHAFTRGQYEKIHPTSGTGDNIVAQTVSFITTYAKQMWIYLDGLREEFSLVFLLIALVMFLFYRAMQKRERAWTLGVTAIFLTLGPFLLVLLNPPPDRQAKELIRVFFTASHVLIAMGVGYGMTLIAAAMATQYERFRTWFWAGGAVAAALALFSLAESTQAVSGAHPNLNGLQLFFHAVQSSFQKDQYGLPIHAGLILLGMTLVFTAAVLLWRQRAPIGLTLLLFAIMPLHSVMTHWFDNEQRGHLFGYWFGHDMFTPPFPGPDGKLIYDAKLRAEAMKDPARAKLIYPEMTRDAILYGGTDPGRFCPTYMIFCESFIPPSCKPRDPDFDRRDVFIITQNALADGTYLEYIRSHYNRSTQKDPPFFQELLRGKAEQEQGYKTNFLAWIAGKLLDTPFEKLGASIEARRRREGVYPPKEMYIASPEDSQRCFQEYLSDAQQRLQKGQLKPGEDVRIIENRVQVSGQVAVMSINGLLTKVMFDHNPTNEFFVEESFPLEWMYPHLTPFGVIMKINRQTLPSLPEDVLARDHEFWARYSERLIGNWITYDTPVKDIVAFVEKVYLRHDFSGFKGDRKFVRDDQAQKAFSKLRSSIGGVYAWRMSGQCPPEFRPKTNEEFERIRKEADFTFRQAFAFCPYSPEAVFRYINLLLQFSRVDDALLIAETCLRLDPYNGQVLDLVNRLHGFKKGAAEMEHTRSTFQQMEAEVKNNPTNFQAAFNLASAYMQMQQTGSAVAVLDRVLSNPRVDPSALVVMAQAYSQMGHGAKATALLDRTLNDPRVEPNVLLAAAQAYAHLANIPQLEVALEKLVKLMPDEPETWYDLAALKIRLQKPAESLEALRHALDNNTKRLAQNPKALDLRNSARTNPDFNPLRQMPEFQKLVPP